MTSNTAFSLFPSPKEHDTGKLGAYNVPRLNTRQSMLVFTQSSWLDQQQNLSENAMGARAPSPAQHASMSSTKQASIASKSQISRSSTDRHFENVETSPQPLTATERPFSPDSYLNQTERSYSPTLVASSRNSMSTLKTRKKPPPTDINTSGKPQIRSIFPTYDPERSLDQQYYLPTQTSPKNIPWEQVCKAPYSPDFEAPKTDSSTKGLLFTAPSDSSSHYTPEIELPTLWELSQGRANAEARSQTYRLQMHRHAQTPKKAKASKRKSMGLEPLLTFGPSVTTPFFSVFSEPCTEEVSKGVEKAKDRVRIRKHNLSRFDWTRDHCGDSSILVSDMLLDPKESSKFSKTMEDIDNVQGGEISKITPHKAVLDSLSVAGTSSAAANLATVDPGASSIAAAHLAEQAMSLAKRKHTCNLTFSTAPEFRQRGYSIRHPSLGYFHIQVDGDVRLSEETFGDVARDSENTRKHSQKPGSVKLMAPVSETIPPMYGVSTSSQTSFRHQSKILASIDLPSATLTLDGAALTELNDRYMVDTAVSALVSVLLAETACPRVSHLTHFAPPPTKETGRGSSKAVAKYKYFPLIKTKKQPKVSRVDKTTADMEDGMTIAFGAMVFVLGGVVEGLGKAVEQVKAQNTRT